ncbi:MAG: hypothetical protein ACP5NE_03465 [Candidatus Micrarchaeia archaeon]
MAGKAISNLAIAMGVIVILADLYWTAVSYAVPLWLALGLIILVASVIWLIADIKMRGKS